MEVKVTKTMQDLLACGQNERARMDFISAAIADHRSSALYRTAVDAQLYYNGENPTISRYEKIIYDLNGRAHRDLFTANHKIKSEFLTIAVRQENSYLLGNGVTFSKESTKKKLGTVRLPFDLQISRAGEAALIGGVSYGFWNMDHLDVFRVTEFVPLEDEENGALTAGIRFWQIDDTKPMRATLYEPDGYTEYIRRRGKDMEILVGKRPYIIKTVSTELDGTRIYAGENYPGFPIVPLKNNEQCRSELCGRRNTIDALDLARSNMVNNVDEGNLIYWVLTNCGGMDDIDDVKFIERLKTLRVAHADGDSGAKAEPHTVEAPFTGTQATIEMLKKALYEDFMAFDSAAVYAGNQTATAVKASYVPLDLKTDEFERQVTAFIGAILDLAGVDDSPSYTRNQIVNRLEEAQTVLLSAPYVTSDYMTKKLLTILGDADQADAILKELSAEDLERFGGSAQNDYVPEQKTGQGEGNGDIDG